MPLGLVAGVRTQGQVWPFQEVHHCATHVVVAKREKKCPYIYGLNDEAVKKRTILICRRSQIELHFVGIVLHPM